jgi:CO/xanthine dehydrogenase Mo-binding subunit
MSVIGQSVRRVDALGKVTGKTAYPGDIDRPNQLYMKVLFAERPHAIIRRIDTSQAEAQPGVVAVFTAADVPVNEYGLIMPDQPVLCGPGSGKPYADRVRFVGDQVALVIAETEQAAMRGAEKIAVEYDPLPVVTDPVAAMREDSPRLHPDRGSNIFCHYRIRKGDVERAFQSAAAIVEAEYRTPPQEHAYLQPEAGVAYIDEADRVTVEIAGQWTHEDRQQIAHALGIPEEKIRVVYPAIGGAFGGREDMSLQIVLALAAWRLEQRGIHRPVKTIWSRRESIIGHHKRHPYVLRAKWGADERGKVTAAEMEVIQDGGAYAYTSTKVLGNTTLMCTGPYMIPNVKVDAYSVYTNHLPGGAFRGFGGPQGAFAAEGQMSKLAEVLEMDPVEIRIRNALTEGALLSVGTPLPKGVSIGKVIDKAAEEAGWRRTGAGWERPPRSALGRPRGRQLKRGLGFACAFKNVGFSFGAPEAASATIELHGTTGIERVVLHHAGADVGQGAHTVMAQMAAEAVGVPIDKVQLVVSDTAYTDDSGSASASRMTFMSGNSIRGAAKAALKKWHNEERPATATYRYRPPKTTIFDPQTGKSEPNFAYGYVAQAAIVDVDVETGEIELVDVVSANDVGRAINPRLVQGQVEGGIVQATGYALLENFQQSGGAVQTDQLSTYLIPTVLDVPERVRAVILEYADPLGPYGARGMAEMPFLPLTAAVVAAVRDAVGVWFDEFPLVPGRVLARLRNAEG